MSWFALKPQKEDCTYANLPHNRKEAFFDIVHNRYDILLGFILLYLLSLSPLAIVFALSLLAEQSLISQGLDNTSLQVQLWWNSFFRDLLYFPASLLFFVVLAGSLKIYRKLAFQEPILFWGDFGRGIKENFFFVLGTGALGWIGFLLAEITKNSLFQGSALWQIILGYIPFSLFILIVLPALLYALAAQPIYTDSWGKKIKNGFRFVVAHLWVSLLYGILFSQVWIILEVGIVWLDLAFFLWFCLLLPFLQLSFVLTANHFFDEDINFEHFPELYGRGIYPRS